MGNRCPAPWGRPGGNPSAQWLCDVHPFSCINPSISKKSSKRLEPLIKHSICQRTAELPSRLLPLASSALIPPLALTLGRITICPPFQSLLTVFTSSTPCGETTVFCFFTFFGPAPALLDILTITTFGKTPITTLSIYIRLLATLTPISTRQTPT